MKDIVDPTSAGAGRISMDFDRLRFSHPDRKHIGGLVDVPAGYETCAIQISYAFNNAGRPIQNQGYPFKDCHGGKVRVMKIGGQLYLPAVQDVCGYLIGKYGKPENFRLSSTKGDAFENLRDGAGGRNGILTFGYRHVDLWCQNDIHKHDMYLESLWTCDSVKKRGYFFWEVGG